MSGSFMCLRGLVRDVLPSLFGLVLNNVLQGSESATATGIMDPNVTVASI